MVARRRTHPTRYEQPELPVKRDEPGKCETPDCPMQANPSGRCASCNAQAWGIPDDNES